MKAEEVLNQYARGDRDFSAANLSEVNLSGANLSGINFSGANLSVANLSGTTLTNANLSRAKLNVTKFSGANLCGANLSEANLNVANLALADLTGANLSQASLVRSELTRADLSSANLCRSNLNGADLKDAKLRHANLAYANLSRTDLKWAILTAANLFQANLHGADLSSANFCGADLSSTELRQANLSRANLSGVNLNGANLRWADLSGADLSWADLSGAKLSGANLTGANLSYANLSSTSLVHVDLTRANLNSVDWSGADLSGATLTGAKLHDVLRFGIKTEGIVCDWVDLSPNGDQSQVQRLNPHEVGAFFHAAPPTVQIVVDAPFDFDAHHLLAATYRQLAKETVHLPPPNLQSGRRRTTLTFEMEQDEHLFLTAYVAILPFQAALETQKQLVSAVQRLQTAEARQQLRQSERGEALIPLVDRLIAAAINLHTAQSGLGLLPAASRKLLPTIEFFQAPTRTLLLNSSGEILTLYNHPLFGKRLIATADSLPPPAALPVTSPPELERLVQFIQRFHWLDRNQSPSG